MTSEQECYVYIVLPGATEFVTAGRFRLTSTPDDNSVGRFVYGRSYLQRPDAVPLDPVELTLRRGEFETARQGGLFGAIRDSMPDYWGRRIIERQHKESPLGELEYLLQGPDDRAGALGFGRNVEPPAPRRRFNQTLHLEHIHALADTMVADEPSPADADARQVEELLLLGTSMGGARPKTVVEGSNALWIAKFGRHDDRWNNPRVEHGLLELGRICGITVTDSTLTNVGGHDVLLVRRFDRDRAEHGYLRHRMVSALTLLGTDEVTTVRDDWSYILLADEIRRTGGEPVSDLRELFTRMCFNAAVSNTDDHPRNHAMLAKGGDWRLSPAFDLTPAPQTARERRDLAMVCGEAGRYANRDNLLSNHGRFLLSREQAESVFDTIVATVRSEWRPTMRRTGVSEQDCKRIENAFLYDGLFYHRPPPARSR